MASVNDVFSALESLGFGCAGEICYGTWKGYAISFDNHVFNLYFVRIATRVTKPSAAFRKELRRAAKAHKLNMLVGDMGIGMKRRIDFSFKVPKNTDLTSYFTQLLDVLVNILQENGVPPADTCAVSGKDHPDSLCLMASAGAFSYQPVNAAAIRDQNCQTKERVERNELSGNYGTGFIGALLGMIVGLIPNLLYIIFLEDIYVVLFALVPLCAFFGYKLFRGRMNAAAIVIVIVLSLVGVVLIPYLETVFYLVRDEGIALGDALSWTAQYYTDPKNLAGPEVASSLRSELLQLLLFMGLGIIISLGLMRSKTNSNVIAESEAQLATLRPNPNYAPLDSPARED